MCSEDQYVCLFRISVYECVQKISMCVCSEYQYISVFRRSVCVFAAPVGDGGSGGRLDRSAAGDEGFLPVGTWRTVSGLYRPGTASAEGPPCSKHRAWSV